MDNPHKDDFPAWREKIRKLTYEQMGITIKPGNSLSWRDVLKAKRWEIINEMDYWRQRSEDEKLIKWELADTNEDSTLSIHNQIGEHFKMAAMIGMKSPPHEADGIFEDMATFCKQLAKDKAPKSYSFKVFVGNSLSIFLSENRWPGRRELSEHLKTRRRPITRTNMDLCLEYFEVLDFVRDNQKG